MKSFIAGPIPSLLSQVQFQLPKATSKPAKKKASGVTGHILVLGARGTGTALPETLHWISEHSADWQIDTLKEQSGREVLHFAGAKGPVWIFSKRSNENSVSSHAGRLDETDYSWHRDQAGGILGYAKAYRVRELQISFSGTSSEQERGFMVGLELASYTYKSWADGIALKDLPKILMNKVGENWDQSQIDHAAAMGVATNLARHLVNTPPNIANPASLAQIVVEHFANKKNFEVEVWNEARLQKEKMGLHLGVGQGSETPPCLVHLRYRPGQAKEAGAPIAFVGKGVTFDTGGLDLKPSSGMRLMKKDMGGAASLIGLAHWVAEAQPAWPIDIYLGFAENSVDAKSMRPSDVLVSRSGTRVEIHNTDAEGRLVLADALDVAVTASGKNAPSAVIDVATLTGAIKTALGAEIAGLFSNHDNLADALLESGSAVGEPNWRMPLYQRYNRGMDSAFADVVNAVDGFGGAITAALFLEKFVQGTPWAHLDIYAWNDKPSGGLSFSGGNGQPVQTLVQFLQNVIRNGSPV